MNQDSALKPRWKRILRSILIGFAVLIAALLLFVGGAVTGVLGLRSLGQSATASAGRIVDPGGIEERQWVTLGGVRQWITVRGQNRRNPILLYLHGGPGGTISDISYVFQRPWEDFFTVVQWDQRGFGRSAVDADKLGDSVNREQVIKDGIELIEQLRRRFGQDKVVLVGQSWGTVPGASIARRRPDLVHAYIGIGQLTEWEGNFLETRRLLEEHAAKSNDAALKKEVAAIGPAPDSRDYAAYQAWLNKVQAPSTRLGHAWHNGASLASWAVTAAFNSDSISNRDLWGMIASPPSQEKQMAGMFRSLVGWRFDRDVGTSFQVPVVLAIGRHDWTTPVTLVDRLYDRICDTPKAIVHLEHSAHVVLAEEPGRVLKLLLDYGLPAATGAPVPGLATTPCAAPAVSGGQAARATR